MGRNLALFELVEFDFSGPHWKQAQKPRFPPDLYFAPVAGLIQYKLVISRRHNDGRIDS